MSIPSVHLPPLPAAPSAAAPPAAPLKSAGGATVGFDDLVRNVLQDINQQQVTADQAVSQLATGEADNVHGVVLTAVQADLAVRMLFAVRNQLVQTYQEVMRMQI